MTRVIDLCPKVKSLKSDCQTLIFITFYLCADWRSLQRIPFCLERPSMNLFQPVVRVLWLQKQEWMVETKKLNSVDRAERNSYIPGNPRIKPILRFCQLSRKIRFYSLWCGGGIPQARFKDIYFFLTIGLTSGSILSIEELIPSDSSDCPCVSGKCENQCF